MRGKIISVNNNGFFWNVLESVHRHPPTWSLHEQKDKGAFINWSSTFTYFAFTLWMEDSRWPKEFLEWLPRWGFSKSLHLHRGHRYFSVEWTTSFICDDRFHKSKMWRKINLISIVLIHIGKRDIIQESMWITELRFIQHFIFSDYYILNALYGNYVQS